MGPPGGGAALCSGRGLLWTEQEEQPKVEIEIAHLLQGTGKIKLTPSQTAGMPRQMHRTGGPPHCQRRHKGSPAPCTQMKGTTDGVWQGGGPAERSAAGRAGRGGSPGPPGRPPGHRPPAACARPPPPPPGRTAGPATAPAAPAE
jgi:hypothetical protein